MIGGFPEAAEKYGPWRGAPVAIGGLVAVTLRGLLMHGVTVHHVLREPDGRLLEPLTRLLEDGAIRAVIDRDYPLAEIAEAHRHQETGRARGKIVIDVAS